MNGSSLDRRTTASLGTAVRPIPIGDDEQLHFASDADTIEACV